MQPGRAARGEPVTLCEIIIGALLISIPPDGRTCEVTGVYYLDRERDERGVDYQVRPFSCFLEVTVEEDRIVIEQMVLLGRVVVIEVPDEVGTGWTTWRYSWGSRFAWFDAHRLMVPVVVGLRVPG